MTSNPRPRPHQAGQPRHQGFRRGPSRTGLELPQDQRARLAKTHVAGEARIRFRRRARGRGSRRWRRPARAPIGPGTSIHGCIPRRSRGHRSDLRLVGEHVPVRQEEIQGRRHFGIPRWLTSEFLSSAVNRSCSSPIVSGSIRLMRWLLKVKSKVVLADSLLIDDLWVILISVVVFPGRGCSGAGAYWITSSVRARAGSRGTVEFRSLPASLKVDDKFENCGLNDWEFGRGCPS